MDSNSLMAAPALGGNVAFIQGLYRDVLGRAPQPEETASWTNALQQGLSPVQAALGFLVSPEHDNRLIVQDYAALLGRQPDPAGAASGLGLLQATGRDELLTTSILASPEYYQRAAARTPAS